MIDFIENPFPVLVIVVSLFSLIALLLLLHWKRLKLTQKEYQKSISQLALLREIIAGLQRHRGLSNGLLCGDKGLQSDLNQVRNKLDDRVQKARLLASNHLDAWNSLFDHWSRLRQHRQIDAANNLAQHHLIIRNSIFLLQDLAADQDLTAGNSELSYLPCIWQEVIQAAEWAGQARALGTGIAAARASSPEQRIRLKFLYQKIQELSNRAFQTLGNHLNTHRHPNPTFNLHSCQQAVRQLLTCIDQELLASEEPQIPAKIYFQQATQAIDQLFSLVDVSLQQLQEPQKQ